MPPNDELEAPTSTESSGVKPIATSPPEPFAWRGGQPVDDEDLRVHLAMLLRLEHVGVLLGAGASVAAGGRVVTDVWADVQQQSLDADLKEHQFDARMERIEDLINEVHVAVVEARRLESQTRRIYEDFLERLQRAIIKAAVLHPDLWDDAGDRAHLDHHVRMLLKLTGARQPGQLGPWVFTPNYDLAIEWAAELAGLHITDGFQGFHQRTFSPHVFDLAHRNTLARGEARFGTYDVYLAKLHGSLSWRTVGKVHPEIHDRPAHALKDELFTFVGDGARPDGLVVYPGAMKYDLTNGYVLGELFRRFTEFVSRPQSALIVSGYSFSDRHLNRVIEAGLKNPTFHLVVYLPEIVAANAALDASRTNDWVRRLARLELPNVTFVGGGSSAYFAALVKHLPDPIVYDETSEKLRNRLRGLRDPSNVKAQAGVGT